MQQREEASQLEKKKLHQNSKAFRLLTNITYDPDELRSIRWAPNLAEAGFVPRPLPKDNGFALVVGGGAAIAAQGSLSSKAALAFVFRGLEVVLGGATAIEPHKPSSSFGAAGCTFTMCGTVLGAGTATGPHRSSSSPAFDVLVAAVFG